jgi:ADP-heptose:LPS heptosyltransferase
MSNILIIKHGSLGDIAQACGAIQDISENHKDDEVHLLTTKAYFDLFKKNPHISDVILDKRLPRFNLIYLYSLMKNIKKYKFSKFMIYKTQAEQLFIKEYYFLMQQKTHGHLLKPRYQKELQKKILIKTQFYLGLIIS